MIKKKLARVMQYSIRGKVTKKPCYLVGNSTYYRATCHNDRLFGCGEGTLKTHKNPIPFGLNQKGRLK